MIYDKSSRIFITQTSVQRIVSKCPKNTIWKSSDCPSRPTEKWVSGECHSQVSAEQADSRRAATNRLEVGRFLKDVPFQSGLQAWQRRGEGRGSTLTLSLTPSLPLFCCKQKMAFLELSIPPSTSVLSLLSAGFLVCADCDELGGMAAGCTECACLCDVHIPEISTF